MQIFRPAKHSAETDNDTVLVLRDSEDAYEKTEGGLYKPQRAVELASQGRVCEAAEGSKYKRGERIVFVKYAGAEIELDGVVFLLLKEKEVQGTINIVDSPNDASKTTDEEANIIMQEALAKLEAEAAK